MSTTFTRGENPLKADKLNTAFSERVSRSGDTMQGMLTLVGPPVAPRDAATKQYVDTIYSLGAAYLPLTGGKVSGAITISATASDGVTGPKLYIDNGIGSTTWPGIELNSNDPATQAGARSAAGYIASFRSGKNRWTLELGGSDQEHGGNTGTNFLLRYSDDNGNPLGNALFIDRIGNAAWDGTTFVFGQGSKTSVIVTPGAAPATPATLGTNTGSGLKFTSNVGFNNTTPIVKPTVTGSRAGNAAVTSLITALAAYGLVIDSTTV